MSAQPRRTASNSTRARARPAPAPLPRARRAEFPSFIEPLLATLRDNIPSSGEWLHEIKFDGYRTQAHVRNGKAVIYTRRGHDWTQSFASIAAALRSAGLRDVVLDGEVVVLDEHGLSNFPRLQTDLAQGRTDRLVYYVFDLLYADGFDLRACALRDRKQLLADLLHDAPAEHLRISEHLDAAGGEVIRQACAMHLEGIVSQRADAPYRSGRRDSWIKVKCTKSDSYPIVAFVEKLGANPRRIASLYVGRHEEGRLLYAGKARSGYTDVMARELRERLDPLIRKTSPLDARIRKPKATWVEPVLQAEVQYSTITSDGLLREAVFKGVRDDLLPPTPRVAAKSARTSTRGRVPKENILQLLPDAVVPDRAQLIPYWTRMHQRALKYLARRPLKLVRHVHGTTFYHMGRLPPIPAAVHQLKVRKREGGEGTRLWVDDLDGLLSLVEIGVIELHPWNATVDDIERPDMLVFDFDPGAGVDWAFVVDSALAMRELLRAEGLSSWPKLTGGKGVHVMAPVQPAMTHDEAHAWCRNLAQRLARTQPSRYTLSATMQSRRGRLFIDYLRNGRGTTAVGTYSPRARPGLPIAAPVSWKQLEQGIAADAFTLAGPVRKRKTGRS